MKNNIKGSISIFTAIIFFVVFALSGFLVDSVRLRVANGQIKRSLKASVDSLLAEYNLELYESYGLLCLENINPSALNDALDMYMNKNLTCDVNTYNTQLLKFGHNNYINLFDYQVEGIKINTMHNLSENKVLEKQIINYSKYKVPKKILVKLEEEIGSEVLLNETGILKDKIKLDISFNNINNELETLINLVESINTKGFIKDCKSISQELVNIAERISILKDRLEDIRDRISELDGEENKSKKTSLVKIKREICKSISKLNKEKKEKSDILNIMINKQIKYLKSINKDTQEIEKYNNQKNIVENIIKSDLEKIKSKKIKNNIKSDFNYYSKYYNFNKIKDISIKSINNLDISNEMLKRLKREDYEFITEKIDDYYYIEYIDNRKSINSKYKSLYPSKDDISSIINYFLVTTTETQYEDLRKKLPSYRDITGGYPNKIISEKTLEDLNNTFLNFDILPIKIFNNIEFIKGIFALNIFKNGETLWSKVLSGIHEGTTSIYINEYILDNFKNRLSKKNSETNYMGTIKDKLKTHFNCCEAEYILYGSLDERHNKLSVEREIALLRFVLNILYLYKDIEKNNLARQIALSLAGITGLGVPIAHTLILSVWAGAETKKDMKKLFNCGKVPLFKTKKDWATHINSKYKRDVNNSMLSTDMAYRDYLRLLLLCRSKKTRLERIQDLIQLNMSIEEKGFKTAECNTMIYTTVKVSVKKLFQSLFIRFKNKSKSRYEYELQLYRGY